MDPGVGLSSSDLLSAYLFYLFMKERQEPVDRDVGGKVVPEDPLR